MTKPRKTIAVAEIVDRANFMLQHSVDDYAAQRAGVAGLLETLLMETNSYRGFGYWSPSDRSRLATPEEVAALDFDESRRRYYGGTK